MYSTADWESNSASDALVGILPPDTFGDGYRGAPEALCDLFGRSQVSSDWGTIA